MICRVQVKDRKSARNAKIVPKIYVTFLLTKYLIIIIKSFVFAIQQGYQRDHKIDPMSEGNRS